MTTEDKVYWLGRRGSGVYEIVPVGTKWLSRTIGYDFVDTGYDLPPECCPKLKRGQHDVPVKIRIERADWMEDQST